MDLEIARYNIPGNNDSESPNKRSKNILTLLGIEPTTSRFGGLTVKWGQEDLILPPSQ